MASDNQIKSFDAFLDSVAHMQDDLVKFEIHKSPVSFPSLDSDDLKASLLERFEFSSSSDDSDLSDDSDDSLNDKHAFSSSQELQWLRSQLDQVAKKSSMTTDELYSTVIGIVTSESSDDDLQSTLPEIIGYEHLDLVIEIISKRQSLINSVRFLCLILQKRFTNTYSYSMKFTSLRRKVIIA